MYFNLTKPSNITFLHRVALVQERLHFCNFMINIIENQMMKEYPQYLLLTKL